MKKKEKNNISKYGEFIPSCFNWITLNKQKEKAEELEKMTKKEQDR